MQNTTYNEQIDNWSKTWTNKPPRKRKKKQQQEMCIWNDVVCCSLLLVLLLFARIEVTHIISMINDFAFDLFTLRTLFSLSSLLLSSPFTLASVLLLLKSCFSFKRCANVKSAFYTFFSLISLLFFFQFCFVVSFVYEANLLKVTKTMNENHFVVSAMNMDVFFSSIVFISRLWFGCADDYRKNYYGNACNQGANSKKAKKMKFII